MPVRVVKRGDTFRVVEPDGKPARSAGGVAADGGGLGQAAANNLRDRLNTAKKPAEKKRAEPARNLGKTIGRNLRRILTQRRSGKR